MSWFSRRAPAKQLAGPFGPLEWRVLESLWDRADHASVRDLQPAFPEMAYTTLMTTMDRLHRKGMLERAKVGRAFVYRSASTRAEFESAHATEALRVVLEGDGTEVGSLMSFFVDAVSERDRELLDELEALVKSRRAEIERTRS
jgi:predicted transcriptional regulator